MTDDLFTDYSCYLKKKKEKKNQISRKRNIYPFSGGSEILIPSEEGSLDEPVTDKPVATVKPSVQTEVLRPVQVGEFVEYFWSSLDSGYLIKQWEVICSCLLVWYSLRA